jgi:peptidoglycan hydrolase-like protein with peptidoglycan-binding domain
MLITSMGIFGFLSKAHIEQTAQSTDNLARVETIQSEIDRQLAIVNRAETRIQTLENSTSDNSAEVQAQIDKEQERIDNAYTRIQPAIQEQNQIIAGVTQLFQQELDRIDEELATLQGYIDTGEIAKAQGMVGAKADGAYGPKTAAAFTAFQDAKRAERNEWLQKIQEAANSPTVVAARDEIARLRNKAEQQIADSNTLINRLRDQLGNSDNADEIQKSIDEQNERVRTASSEIDRLTEEKIQLESEYRKLEAEVGPIKYIAEFIYGDTADNNMLEEAVRWVIITIIFVFDPLAVLLLIASQYTFEYRRKDDSGGWLRQYEQARAQRIIDNPGYNVDAPKEEANENDRRENTKETEQVDTSLPEAQPSETIEAQDEADTVVVAEEEREIDVTENTTATDDTSRDMVSEDGTANTDASDIRMEQTEVQIDEDTKQQLARSYLTLEPEEDEEVHVETEEQRQRREYVDTQELQESVRQLKQQWKAEHPNDSIKSYKKLYIHGKIDSLPWIPQEVEQYIQNGEQSDDSIWNKIQNNRS